MSRTRNITKMSTVLPRLSDGRLTLTSGDPDKNGEDTNKDAIYYCPYMGETVSLFDGDVWNLYTFSELTLDISSGYSTDTIYDIFIYDNLGTLTLESLAWSSASARATDIVRQNGALVKDGDRTKKYIGTFRTNSSAKTNDDSSRRYLWNEYHKVYKSMFCSKNTLPAYTTSVWRPLGNITTVGETRLAMVMGGRTLLDMFTNYHCKGMYTGVGLDNTTSPEPLGGTNGDPTYNVNAISSVHKTVEPGYHFMQQLEYGFTGGQGYNSSMICKFLC